MTFEQDCPPVTCPNCGKDTPAASNRSDHAISYRCDVCAHQWTVPMDGKMDENRSNELPPIPAIDAPGG